MASEMSPERWKLLEPLLDAALELPREDRVAFVKDCVVADDRMRAELLQLLAEYAVPDPLLDLPAAERFASLLDEEQTALPRLLGDRYSIERELGRGGMATVYLAKDVRHDRQVAVKVLRPEIGAALGAERFHAEIRLTAQLHHPHILSLHDSGDAGGHLFYVMPYIEGESLRRRLERERQLSIDDAVRIACEVASALEAAHRRGVVHRDIKPENILLHDGSALVADFGIALAVSEAAEPRRTNPGLALGTPQYMSPEQAAGEGVIDSRSDIYALGTVLYEMLAGEAPFTGASATAVIAKRAAMAAPSLRIVRAAIPAAFDTVVSRALARDPADRYRTAAEFAEALKQSLASSASEDATRTAGVTGRRLLASRSFVVLTIIALAAAGVAGIGKLNDEARSGGSSALGAVNSIAVLRLATVGSDTANGYFAEGMADFLSSALGRVPGIRLIPSRSTASLAGTRPDMDLKALGKQLGVELLLRGSVFRADGHLQVVIDLVSASTGTTVWSNTYRRSIQRASDLFAVQDDIVKDIASQLRATLGGAVPVAPSHPKTENLEALDLYLQGRFFLDKRVPGHVKARDYFERAIAMDSNLAVAHAGLAEVYVTYAIGNMGDYRPATYYPLARKAARRALALDSLSADAHAALGAVKILDDFDWSGAERDLSRALRLDARSTAPRVWRTIILEFAGRFEEALTEARAAVDNDPRSMMANMELGRAYFFARRYDQAKQQYRRIIERDSAMFRAHLLLGQVLAKTGEYDSALAELGIAQRLAPGSSRITAYLAHTYAVAGRTGDALRELGALHERSRTAYVPALDFAVVYAGLNRTDETFKWLGKAFDDHSIRPYLMDPTFDAIRSDPRYRDVLLRLHLAVPTVPR